VTQTAGFVWSAETADREKLLGEWVQQGSADSNGWTISGTPDGLQIVQTESGRPIASFECNTQGRDCEIKDRGHKETVSMYYNGPALVLLETKNDKVTKRRFSVLPAGNALKLELIPMSGGGQVEESHFERKNATEARNKQQSN